MSKVQLADVLQIKVTLRNVRPLVWRRILVPAEITLHKFHRVLQGAMGWTNSHLHQFIIDRVAYSNPRIMDEFDDFEDERNARLISLVGDGIAKFTYEYDFGDGWVHDIVIEKKLSPEDVKKYPFCIAGARECPLEDCGGPFGYEELLEILKDKTHPEHEERKAWCGPYFEPERFNIGEVNDCLGKIR